MTEFAVGTLLVFVPLLLGIIYLGKYEDIKYSAIQASRYAAFERVFDPSSAHKNATVLAEETRARFFTDPKRSNGGAVGFQDSTQSPQALQTNGTLNWNWYGTNGAPAISQYSNIDVTVQPPQAPQSPTLTDVSNTLIDKAADLNFAIKDPGIAQAHVKVPLAQVSPFMRPLDTLNLTIDASTSVLTDGFNAGGAGSRYLRSASAAIAATAIRAATSFRRT